MLLSVVAQERKETWSDNYWSNRCESNNTLLSTTQQETQMCQSFDDGRSSGRLRRLHTVMGWDVLIKVLLSFIVNLKVNDMLLCFPKKIIINLFWPDIALIWGLHKLDISTLFSLTLFLDKLFGAFGEFYLLFLLWCWNRSFLWLEKIWQANKMFLSDCLHDKSLL